MWDEEDNFLSVLQNELGGDRYSRGRIFFCCVSEQEIMVVTDNRRRLDKQESRTFSNVFVLTTCERCARRIAARQVPVNESLDDIKINRTPPQDAEVKLRASLLGGCQVHKTIREYCKDHLSSHAFITDSRVIQHELEKYYVRTNAATLEYSEAGDKASLKVLPYSDPGFF